MLRSGQPKHAERCPPFLLRDGRKLGLQELQGAGLLDVNLVEHLEVLIVDADNAAPLDGDLAARREELAAQQPQQRRLAPAV